MRPLEVTVTEETMVFAVSSRSRPGRKTYRVDLLSLAGYSECACIDWSTRRHAGIKAGLPMGTREVCCIHVLAARNQFLNGLLQRMAQGEEET